ncbi:MAG TPA: divalent-cation tolerance protein CutA [Oligoflexia bacterium]|nr:divalent-cation tolerance protein CutA [Oligoflexia bacterium]HMP48083.1 divalent-cation tolerance protein CutA [Oligoflexia bacterium]
MKNYIVFVTAPDINSARLLARKAVSSKLAACVNIIPEISSIYLWENEIKDESEVQLLFKTSEKCLKNLEKLILDNHPYEVPEFIAIQTDHIEGRYKAWLNQCLDFNNV